MQEFPLNTFRTQGGPFSNVEFRVPDTLRWECMQCGKCCEETFNPPHTEKFPHMTIHEVARIAKLLKRAPLTFCDAPNIQYDQTENLVMNVLFTPKYREGTTCSCIFFDPSANLCAIHDAKPLACRLYPFHYQQVSFSDNKIMLEVNRGCPGIGKGRVFDRKEVKTLVLQIQRSLIDSILFWSNKKISMKPAVTFQKRAGRRPTSEELIELLALKHFLSDLKIES